MPDDSPKFSRLVGPSGCIVEFGEQTTPDGPVPYLALCAPGQPPSWLLYVDPVSYQPMFKLRIGRSEPPVFRLYPADKCFRDTRWEAVDSDEQVAAEKARLARQARPRFADRLRYLFTGKM